MSPKLAKTRFFDLRIEELENRITPVLGNNALAPLVDAGTGYDGVVLITSTIGGSTFTGTGFLLPSGRHILTAAHNFTNSQNQIGLDKATTVSFDLPNVGRINVDVPIANVVLNPGYSGGPENDLAVLTLPVLAPSGPVGTLGAERYPIYRNSDEIGQVITIVGYGTIGTGTTGQQENAELTKRIAQNKYDTVGTRVNFGGSQALLYDFDNGTTANDAFGRILGINDTGLTNEGTSGQGDSGGPVFFRINNQLVVAGTTTSGPGDDNPENPAVINRNVQAGFGSISHDTRLSFHASWIDSQSIQPAAEAIDLRTQSVGQDSVADNILVRVVNGNLEILVNGDIYQSTPVAGVTSLTLTGAGDANSAVQTTVTIDVSVPTSLAITQQRILTFTDNRMNAPQVLVTPVAPLAASLPASQPIPNPKLTIDLDTFPNAVAAGSQIVVGADAGGGPRVTIYDALTGRITRDFFGYESTFTGGVRTALGDVNGDFIEDIIVAAGPGGGPRVRIFDGVTGSIIRDFFVFEPTFTGGVFVAVGDINGDGIGDIIIGAGVGGGPRVVILDGETNEEIDNFFAFESTLRNGVTVAAGDVNDDGLTDIIVGAGAGGAPRVTVFDGATLEVLSDFFAFDSSLRTGVWVAAGDIEGGGIAEVFAGVGAGGGSGVRSFEGVTGKNRLNFSAFTPTATGGARIALADTNDDGLADIVVGSGLGDMMMIRSFDGSTGSAGRDYTSSDTNFRGGVFVGGNG